jgi:hypothetical protein
VSQSKYDHKLSNIPACNGGIGSWPKASMIISLVVLPDAMVELALVTQSKHGHKLGKNCRMQRWNWLVAQSKYDHKLSSIAGCNVELALVTQSKHGHKLGKNCRMQRWNWLVAQSKYDHKLSSIAGCNGGIGSWPKASMIISLVVLPDAKVELALVTQSKHGNKLGKNCRMQRWNWLVTQSKHRHKLGKKLPDAKVGIGSWPKANMIISLVILPDVKVELDCGPKQTSSYAWKKIVGCKGGIGSWPKASMIISLVILPDAKVELARDPKQASS